MSAFFLFKNLFILITGIKFFNFTPANCFRFVFII